MRLLHAKILLVLILVFLVLFPVVSAVKTAEGSLGGTIARGSRFTVTIIGLPNTEYYIWVPHTSTMTGAPHDQPPVIAGSQSDIRQDPPEGPWPIGSYRFSNGGGMTIRDDIPPSLPDFPNTRYYALVKTDSAGQATVEFLTSFNTAIRSFSVKAENPRSVDSDNLQVLLSTYSRGVTTTGIPATSQPVTTTVQPTTASTPPPTVTTLPETTGQIPAETTTPVQTPTQKAPLEIWSGIFALVAGLLVMRKP